MFLYHLGYLADLLFPDALHNRTPTSEGHWIESCAGCPKSW